MPQGQRIFEQAELSPSSVFAGDRTVTTGSASANATGSQARHVVLKASSCCGADSTGRRRLDREVPCPGKLAAGDADQDDHRNIAPTSVK